MPIVAEDAGAVDRAGHIGDQPVVPAADLVAEPLGSAEPGQPDWTLGDHTTVGFGTVPDGCRLDNVPVAVEEDFESGVVEVAGVAMLTCGGEGFVDPPEASHDVGARTEGQPVQVDGASRGCRGHGTCNTCLGILPVQVDTRRMNRWPAAVAPVRT